MGKINDIEKEKDIIEIAKKSITEMEQIIVVDANKLDVWEYTLLCKYLVDKGFVFEKYMNEKVYFIKKLKNEG